MMLGPVAQGFPLWQGGLLDLPPKERAVLALLIRRAPEVVSKQAFADEAWQGRPMSDESLARCISRVRRVLPGVPIESVYGAGYRLQGGLATEPPAGHALAHAGQPEAAIRELQATFSDHPDNAIAAIFRIGLLAISKPEPALAEQAWQLAEQRDAPPYALSILSYVLARCGRPDEARVLIDACFACSASSACTAAMHAVACVALGEHERAARLIVSAFDAHCAVVPMLLRDPANAALRTHPQVMPLYGAVFGMGAQI